jgi:hypothetical protein
MSTSYSISGLILAICLLAIPILCVGLGLARVRISQSVKASLLLAIGLGIACVYVVVALAYVLMVGPGRSRIVTEGISPEGRQYCIVQTYKGLVEPYQVTFYIRDASGLWRGNTLAHQDIAWRSATVAFTNKAARITRDGVLFRDIPIPTNTVELAKVQPGYRDSYCPSNFTPQDVLSFHNRRFKQ